MSAWRRRHSAARSSASSTCRAGSSRACSCSALFGATLCLTALAYTASLLPCIIVHAVPNSSRSAATKELPWWGYPAAACRERHDDARHRPAGDADRPPRRVRAAARAGLIAVAAAALLAPAGALAQTPPASRRRPPRHPTPTPTPVPVAVAGNAQAEDRRRPSATRAAASRSRATRGGSAGSCARTWRARPSSCASSARARRSTSRPSSSSRSRAARSAMFRDAVPRQARRADHDRRRPPQDARDAHRARRRSRRSSSSSRSPATAAPSCGCCSSGLAKLRYVDVAQRHLRRRHRSGR